MRKSLGIQERKTSQDSNVYAIRKRSAVRMIKVSSRLTNSAKRETMRFGEVVISGSLTKKGNGMTDVYEAIADGRPIDGRQHVLNLIRLARLMGSHEMADLLEREMRRLDANEASKN